MIFSSKALAVESEVVRKRKKRERLWRGQEVYLLYRKE